MVATGKKGKCARGYGGSKAVCKRYGGPKGRCKSGGGAKVECAGGMGASKAGVPVALETTSPLLTPTPKGMCAHCYGGSEGGFASDMGGGKTSVLVVCRRCAKRFHLSIPPRLAHALVDRNLPVERKL